MSALFSRAVRGATASMPFKVSKRTVFNTQKLWSRENIPVYGFIIGTAAISFQVGVLYPWHEEISVQIDNLEKVTEKIDNLSATLETKISEITALQEKVKHKEGKILQLEELILKGVDEIKISCAGNGAVAVDADSQQK